MQNKSDRAKRALIELVDLTKVYVNPAGRFPALDGITLELEAGEFVSVVGKSGCGKTTLINMITGIDRPTSGEIFVGGTPVHALSEDRMAQWRGRNLGVIFQFFQLLPTLSIADNVMIPMDFCNTFPQRERYKRALHLLDLVDIAEHADKLPSEISGGQQQRAAIARAMANDPPILAADEPTGNLDSKTGDAIFRLFETLVEAGKTLLVVTHDEDLASRASRTIEMSDGVVVSL